MAATTPRICDDAPLGANPLDGRLRRALPLLLAGDADAFEVFYDLTSPLAYGLACHLLGPGPAAELALENAYRAAWSAPRARTPRPEDAVHWILGLVRDQADATPARTA
ncbi:MAG: hypothetical protein ABWX68_03220 [Arthrobacter sp.]|uniref:hypothetical protein n=1 Tax=Arthrobacter sp. TaxID=1667 RepID=UPI003478E91E